MKSIKIKSIVSALVAATLLLTSGCSLNPGSDSSSRSERSERSESSASGKEIVLPNSDGRALYVTGVSGPVAIRATDEDGGEVLAQVEKGAEVTLISTDSTTCYYVSYGDVSGYIKKCYLTDEEQAVCGEETYYTTAQTPLYDSKGDEKNEIQQLKKGEEIIILAKNSGECWYANLKGTKTFGFVKCTDLSTSKPTSDSSSSSTAPTPSPSTDNNKPVTPSRTFGYSTTSPTNYSTYYAYVQTGYLAIRSAMAYDYSNELGRMYTGDAVYVIDKSTGTEYWYCYSPNSGIYGYVNSNYLVTSRTGSQYSYTSDYTVWTVKGTTHYLGLRTAPVYDGNNIIGKIYNGDTVRVYSFSYAKFEDQYWYVYSPTLGLWGYVDSNYIYS